MGVAADEAVGCPGARDDAVALVDHQGKSAMIIALFRHDVLDRAGPHPGHQHVPDDIVPHHRNEQQNRVLGVKAAQLRRTGENRGRTRRRDPLDCFRHGRRGRQRIGRGGGPDQLAPAAGLDEGDGGPLRHDRSHLVRLSPELLEVRLVEAWQGGDRLQDLDLLPELGVDALEQRVGPRPQAFLEILPAAREFLAQPEAGEQRERHEKRERYGREVVDPAQARPRGRIAAFNPANPLFRHARPARPADPPPHGRNSGAPGGFRLMVARESGPDAAITPPFTVSSAAARRLSTG